ncbi:MAG: MFS transporter [Gaiellales bacterium]
MRTRADAYGVYLFLSAAEAFCFSLIVTVNLVYQATAVGLGPFQLVLVGTVLEAVCFVGEVPTGIVADVAGRRLSIVIGALLTGIGFTIEGLVPTLTGVLVAQVVWGLGATFSSGANQAWITDEVGERAASRAFMRGAQLASVAALVAVVPSVALAQISISLPIVVGGLATVALAVVLAAIMPERGFVPPLHGRRRPWRVAAATGAAGLRLVRSRPPLMLFLLSAAAFGASSEGMDRLSTPHLLRDVGLPGVAGLRPVAWFGLIAVAATVLEVGAVELVRRRVREGRPLAALRCAYLVTGGAMAIFALSRRPTAALGGLLIASGARGVDGPLSQAWLNGHTRPAVRATVFSLAGQADAAGQIAGGLALGALAGGVSVTVALLAGALMLVPAAMLLRSEGFPGPPVAPVPEAPGRTRADGAANWT